MEEGVLSIVWFMSEPESTLLDYAEARRHRTRRRGRPGSESIIHQPWIDPCVGDLDRRNMCSMEKSEESEYGIEAQSRRTDGKAHGTCSTRSPRARLTLRIGELLH